MPITMPSSSACDAPRNEESAMALYLSAATLNSVESIGNFAGSNAPAAVIHGTFGRSDLRVGFMFNPMSRCANSPRRLHRRLTRQPVDAHSRETDERSRDNLAGHPARSTAAPTSGDASSRGQALRG